MMKTKKVQIDKVLYDDILRYFIQGDRSPATEHRIQKGIDADLDARVRREYYTTYKTAPTEEAREAARQKYLDAQLIPEDFRW